MPIQLYNTMSGQKEPLVTVEPNVVKMYVCGPTVYSDSHVGHARSAMVFDIIRRYLEYRGYTVQHVMNYTDVDDKILARAQKEGVEPMVISDRYVTQFFEHVRDLNMLPATHYPRVSELIPEIIEFIQGLIAKEYAYEMKGSVYFRVAKDADYGRLSNRTLEEARGGTRVAVDEEKEDPADFALWKGAKEGEWGWDSPWGKGRPGWHIECSTMSYHILGEEIDIHGGGNDLIFPHHENEIAQTESLTEKNFARFWVHNGMLQMDGEKMSKSIGNVFGINDFLAQYDADVFRLIVLNSGYRNPLAYNQEVIEQSQARLARLQSGLKPAFADAKGADEKSLRKLAGQIKTTREQFLAQMDDDFNSAGALGHLFDLVKRINTSRDSGATAEELADAQSTLRELADVFGLRLSGEAKIKASLTDIVELATDIIGQDLKDALANNALIVVLEKANAGFAEPVFQLDGADLAIHAESADDVATALVQLRQGLRQVKQWALSDSVRDRLSALGVVIEDSREGSTWHWE